MVALVLLLVLLPITVTGVLWCIREPHKPSDDPDLVDHFADLMQLPPAEAARMLDETVSPVACVIESRLLLGNATCASHRKNLRRARVTHVLNATPTLPNQFEREGIIYLRLPVDDSLGADLLSHLDEAVDFIAGVLAGPPSGGAVLVHCQQGVSRSATLVIAFLMRERGHSLQSALRHVHARRWIRPNEAFLEQLREYERRLRGDAS